MARQVRQPSLPTSNPQEDLIVRIQERVTAWANASYPDISDLTRMLLRH